ncbi:MAG: hypothetical protein FJ297_14835 [Planctomycetes bacterium]|nr:hypothetical protein [Planctomycetota bacterium]
MRRRNAHVIALMLSYSLTSAAAGQERPELDSVTSKQKWVRFAVVQGRILVVAPRRENGVLSSPDDALVRESFGVHARGSETLVHYERTCSRCAVRFRFHNARALDIERVPTEAGDTAPLAFHQPAAGPISVQIGQGTGARRVAFPSIWHLLLAEPRWARDEVVPLLQRLRPDWRFLDDAAAIETALLCSEPIPASEAWARMLGDLGESRFSVRQAAERRLLAEGPRILPFLEQLDVHALNPEQRARVASIRAALDGGIEDSPARVVAWLENDPRLWSDWREHGTPEHKTLAALRLARLASPSDTAGSSEASLVRTGALRR